MANKELKGLVFGCVTEEDDKDHVSLICNGIKFADKHPQLKKLIKRPGLWREKACCHIFYDIEEEFDGVAVVLIGQNGLGYSEDEGMDEGKENIRTAVGVAVTSLSGAGFNQIEVDSCGDAEAAAEGAYLSQFSFEEMKNANKRKKPANIALYQGHETENSDILLAWEKGRVLAESQNLARHLMELPANKLTPTIFAEKIKDIMSQFDNVRVIVRNKEWAKEKGMNSYLSVAQGSDEPPKFVEVHYSGAAQDDAPICLVGKGITFDSGGISIKPWENMDLMRADQGGISCFLGAVYAAAKLKLKLNIKAFSAMAENMPSGKATKPGDVFTAMNGKTVQVDQTDCEGRLTLADALTYAQTFNPKILLDMATLTYSVMIAFGSGCSGVFTTSNRLWQCLSKAGGHTGDRLWRLPLWKHYSKIMTTCNADVVNMGKTQMLGDASNAAAFLREFVDHKHWAHIDTASVMQVHPEEFTYIPPGLSGRPTRTIIQFLKLVADKETEF